MEREWAQDERKQQAAKPPNQLVREYWEKQNNPYKDKWDALANKIEKAGVARGPQEESYTLDDGSRITKSTEFAIKHQILDAAIWHKQKCAKYSALDTKPSDNGSKYQ